VEAPASRRESQGNEHGRWAGSPSRRLSSQAFAPGGAEKTADGIVRMLQEGRPAVAARGRPSWAVRRLQADPGLTSCWGPFERRLIVVEARPQGIGGDRWGRRPGEESGAVQGGSSAAYPHPWRPR